MDDTVRPRAPGDARSPRVAVVTGRTLFGAELARTYGITDRDGRQPPSFRDPMHVEPANYRGGIER